MIRKTVLTVIALLTMLRMNVQAEPIPEHVIKETIVKHSIEMNIDPALALSIAKKESGFKHELRSPHGAVGVFQLMPSTANRMGFNPYYLSENIKAGLNYYKLMYKMFGSTELALAAYNAGPTNVKKFGGAIPPYAETKRFVNQIMLEYNKQKVNPDPAIAKVKSIKSAQAKPQVQNHTTTIKASLDNIKKTDAKTAPKDLNLPELKEIPEVKNSEPVMEIL